jgi:hypothetical protein
MHRVGGQVLRSLQRNDARTSIALSNAALVARASTQAMRVLSTFSTYACPCNLYDLFNCPRRSRLCLGSPDCVNTTHN